ncbi:MAG: alpha/beta hydrolase [Propionibacteriaceae bacterium]|jgi:pimeloyl-ACP methyl ester carboxylesterase|nr:alpha/beta hydrolase [Propionibacteriaceae bacterium]
MADSSGPGLVDGAGSGGADSTGFAVVDLPGAGPPIIFLHGLGGASTLDYAQVVDAPELRGYRRVLVDLPGFGRSARGCPPRLDCSITGYARFLDAWLNSMGATGSLDPPSRGTVSHAPADGVEPDRRLPAPVVLFGHSAGGAVALSLAALRPERVAGIILTEANLDAGGGTASRAIAERSEESFVSRGHAALVRTERAKANPWAQTVALANPVALHREACSLVAGVTPSWRDIFYALTCPKAYVLGEHNLPDPDVTELPCHGVEVMTVPDTGHNMAWENPAGLGAVVGRFVREAGGNCLGTCN